MSTIVLLVLIVGLLPLLGGGGCYWRRESCRVLTAEGRAHDQVPV